MSNLETFRGHLKDLAFLNLKISKNSKFVDDMKLSIPLGGLLRLHGGGDFYTPKYARDWWYILRDRPDVTAWAYTRSWAVKGFIRDLRRLNNLPNVEIMLSHDHQMPHPHDQGYDDFRTAYMAENNEEEDPLADVVFRLQHHRKTVKKTFGKSIVCPTENGEKDPGINCAVCRHCFINTNSSQPLTIDLAALAKLGKKHARH